MTTRPSLEVAEDSAGGGPALSESEWRARARAHLARVRRYTAPYRQRRSRQEVHPVYDFLFQYYSFSPAKLEAWHPSPREGLVDGPGAREHFKAPQYQSTGRVLRRDVSALTPREQRKIAEVVHVLRGTRERSPNYGCFGVHEWAMVYGGSDIRHAGVAPLRLSQGEVDAFVESRPVACSHFDAFRFFAPEARPMNRVELAWETRHEMEQPGCIHANMDLYRWAYTSMPWIGSDLLWETFELAIELRELDMRASPYDLQPLGFVPIEVETREGRDEYQRRQRELADRAAALRNTLIDAVEPLIATSP